MPVGHPRAHAAQRGHLPGRQHRDINVFVQRVCLTGVHQDDKFIAADPVEPSPRLQFHREGGRKDPRDFVALSMAFAVIHALD